MDREEFVVELIRAAAWPTVALIGILVFRKRISLLRNFKGFGIEAVFEEKQAKLQEQIASIASTTRSGGPTKRQLRMAKMSHAMGALKQCLVEAIGDPDLDSEDMSLRSIAIQAERLGVIEPELHEAIQTTLLLSAIADGDDWKLRDSHVDAFVESIRQLINQIRDDSEPVDP